MTTSSDHAPDGINYCMHPSNIPCLTASKIDCCVLANNHVLDWSRAGLEETQDSLRGARLGTTSAGRNLNEALAPCIINAGAARILVFAFAGRDCGATRVFGPDHPSVSEALRAIGPACSDWRRHGDVILILVGTPESKAALSALPATVWGAR